MSYNETDAQRMRFGYSMHIVSMGNRSLGTKGEPCYRH